MRVDRRPTSLVVVVVRCLVLSFAGHSAVVAPADVAAVTAASPSGGTGMPPPPRHHVDADRTLRFVRRPPSSSRGIASTAHDRRRTSGVGRSRHRQAAAAAFRKSRPAVDVVAPTDGFLYSDSAGSGGVVSDANERVDDRADEYRTVVATDDAAAAETERDDDMTAATARRRLPDVIIIGAKKSGTRALLEFLKIHPDVRAAGPETHFFDRYYDRGLDWYRSRMPATSSGQRTVEKTPSYLVSGGRVVERVFAMDPRVHLLVVVRDPVTRAVSDYTQAAAKRPDIAPFERLAFVAPPRNFTHHADLDCWATNETGACPVNTSWGAIRIGLYVRHVTRWLRRFPLSQIHFVHGERLVADPAAEMRLVERFLRLRPVVNESSFRLDPVKGFPCVVRSAAAGDRQPQRPRCLGKTKGRVHRKVDDRALGRLREFFRPFNEQFYRVVGVDFGWS